MKLSLRVIIVAATVVSTAPFAGASSMGITSAITSNFNGTPIPGGDTVWFTAVVTLTGAPPAGEPIDVFMTSASLSSSEFDITVPNSTLVFMPGASLAATSYTTPGWDVLTPAGTSGNTFMDAVEYQVPAGGLPGDSLPVTWTANFSTNVPDVTLNWQWAAAAYSSFSPDYNALGVQPADDPGANKYGNSDHAGTPENYASYVVGGARGGGGSNYTGSYSGTARVSPTICRMPEPSYLLPLGGLLLAAGLFRRRRA